jgi:hypothetical protein
VELSSDGTKTAKLEAPSDFLDRRLGDAHMDERVAHRVIERRVSRSPPPHFGAASPS